MLVYRALILGNIWRCLGLLELCADGVIMLFLGTLGIAADFESESLCSVGM
jgi:hypothetical protein